MVWLVLLAVAGFLIYLLTRAGGTNRQARNSSPRERGTSFLPPIPRGYQIFESRLSVAGLQHHKDDAREFAEAATKTLVLEREPSNAHDSNAIKVIGVVDGETRRAIGYVPREIAEIIVGSGLVDIVQPKLEWSRVSDEGSVDVIFQIIGPKDKKSQYSAYLTGKPASADQKAFLRFFNLPLPRNLSTGEAATMIAAYRERLAGEDPRALDEWNAYAEICDEFGDADFRETVGVKKVSEKLLKEAIDALRAEGETMRTLADDIDKVVDRVIALKPELERQ